LAEPAALAALLASRGHGYDLKRVIAELTDNEIQVDTGGLYRVLRRLEEDGCVVSSWTAGEAGPDRREYELTPAGRSLAEEWVAHLRERERMTGALAAALESGLGPREASEPDREAERRS
jgi:DNA-binding PadR family transcriptional regulator